MQISWFFSVSRACVYIMAAACGFFRESAVESVRIRKNDILIVEVTRTMQSSEKGDH